MAGPVAGVEVNGERVTTGSPPAPRQRSAAKTTRPILVAVVAVAALTITACASEGTTAPTDGVAATPDDTTGSVATAVATAATVVKATVAAELPPTSATGVSASGTLSEAIGVAVSMTLDGTVIPGPDEACFDGAVAQLDATTRVVAEQLAANPLGWTALDRTARHRIVAASLGCTEWVSVVNMLAVGVINALEVAPCVAAAWSSVLTPDAVASSLAFGTGLDDLPPDVVRALVAGAQPCGPDEQWWIDDVAIELERDYGYSPQAATCVAANFLHRLGLSTVLERRVLTIPLLTLSDAHLATVDVQSCGVTVELPPMTGGDVGDCLADVLRGPRDWPQAPCDGLHNGEIIAAPVLDDATWPGIVTVDERASEACRAALGGAAADRNDVGMVWLVPSRQVWERGGRAVTCIIGPIDGSDWDRPSGIQPSLPAPDSGD
jgi:hypothetical protein